MRFRTCCFSSILLTFLLFNLAQGSGEQIPWWSINAGGNIYSSSASYELCGSIGQSIAGKYVGTYYAYTGFWNPWVATLDVEDEHSLNVPKNFSLYQNYPNPFNPSTTIEYTLAEECQVQIMIYNILGQRVKTLKNEMEKAGFERVIWDGRDENGIGVASGVYFYLIQAKGFTASKKMILVK